MKSEMEWAMSARKIIVYGFIASLLLLTSESYANEKWPGERWQDAVQLGALSPSFSNGDVSGAHWNNHTKTLWVSDNKEEKVWALQAVNQRFEIVQSFKGKGDLEGITQTLDDHTLYLLDEKGAIRSYDARTGKRLSKWPISADLPTQGKKGPEGITFIPNAWLQRSDFVNHAGKRYQKSRYDLGGIFLVAHQNGGRLYAFDLSSTGAYHFLGEYGTAAHESSGLAFDRSTGLLYISHNIGGNSLEITNLASVVHKGRRVLTPLAIFDAPNDSNLEGFAIKPTFNDDKTSNKVQVFYTDDNGNTNAGNALLLFNHFSPMLPDE